MVISRNIFLTENTQNPNTNLKKGDRFVWTVENDVIIIRPINEDS
ncbi:MAG: hypothetical protein QW581_05170 [Archaeoglobaceae archaeon]